MLMLIELWAVKGNLRAAILCHIGMDDARAFSSLAKASCSDKEARPA
jgi:hypothetical protein